jgi:hypothetical protein
MNNLELTSVLEVAVFGLAIAQVLTILLTIRRERDIEHLRELVEGQGLRLAELRAWLAGRNASQTRRMASERKPDPEPPANVKTSESGMPLEETGQPRSPEDDVARATKALEWKREVAARLQSGIKGQVEPTRRVATPAAEDGFKWFKDDPSEPREIAEARGIVNGLGKTSHTETQDSAESLEMRPRAAHDELERINRAVTRLKEDMDQSSGITGLSRKPPA